MACALGGRTPSAPTLSKCGPAAGLLSPFLLFSIRSWERSSILTSIGMLFWARECAPSSILVGAHGMRPGRTPSAPTSSKCGPAAGLLSPFLLFSIRSWERSCILTSVGMSLWARECAPSSILVGAHGMRPGRTPSAPTSSKMWACCGAAFPVPFVFSKIVGTFLHFKSLT